MFYAICMRNHSVIIGNVVAACVPQTPQKKPPHFLLLYVECATDPDTAKETTGDMQAYDTNTMPL